jgi:hypothetical protein
MEEYNRTRCTRVVDHSKTVQNQNTFEPYQALANRLFEMHSTTFIVLERWRNTTGPVVRVWLIIPKTIQNQKAFEPYQALVSGFLKCLRRPL